MTCQCASVPFILLVWQNPVMCSNLSSLPCTAHGPTFSTGFCQVCLDKRRQISKDILRIMGHQSWLFWEAEPLRFRFKHVLHQRVQSFFVYDWKTLANSNQTIYSFPAAQCGTATWKFLVVHRHPLSCKVRKVWCFDVLLDAFIFFLLSSFWRPVINDSLLAIYIGDYHPYLGGKSSKFSQLASGTSKMQCLVILPGVNVGSGCYLKMPSAS